MIEIDKIVETIGYTTLLALLLVALGFLFMGIYLIYDYWLKKLLGWKNIQVRKDIFYFIKHKKEIQDYIKKKSLSNSSSDKSESFNKG